MNKSAVPKVSFALIGDVQFADREPWAGRVFRESRVLLHETIRELNGKNLDFIVSLGDLGDGLAKSEVPARPRRKLRREALICISMLF